MNDKPLVKYLKTADSRSLDVLLWMLYHRDKENIVNATLDDIAKKNSVTKVTVSRVFQKLYREDFLEKIRNGQYRLKGL